MKMTLIILATLLTGCSSMSNWSCYGTGTCAIKDSQYVNANAESAGGSFAPRTIQLGSSSYLVVPNYSSGRITSITRTAK